MGTSAKIAAWLLAAMVAVCLLSLPWTAGTAPDGHSPRYAAGTLDTARLAPAWWGMATQAGPGPASGGILGTDSLGRSLGVRLLAGGAVSLTVGIAAACLSVLIGAAYGAVAGYMGGRVDGVMMRIVDVLYGLPYVLLAVLLAVAADAVVDEWVSRADARQAFVREVAPAADSQQRAAAESEALTRFPPRRLSSWVRQALGLGTLLVAISGVSWLTMARVVRGSVMSLRARSFVLAARAMGASHSRILMRHILPNLWGVILVYAMLTVPQAMLQEAFLSFLGIGVQPPTPSWGTLAAEGLAELNPVDSAWWLIVFPCAAIALTLIALNFLGEGLRRRVEHREVAR